MKEYRVKWCACPHNHNTTQLLFVEAASPEDARRIAHDHIERRGVEWFSIFGVSEVSPVPPGRVLATKEEHK